MRGRLIAGRYRLDEPLGAGGMSTVWAAEDTELGRQVAVKLLARTADRARFEREARAAASLAAPNVVRVFDFGEDDESAYLVLELLTGGSLEERFEPGRPLPDEETERVARGLAAGLAHAHAAGLVHRDLKPANVLFDDDGRPKISDFGVARMEGSGTLTETGTVIGTALTISPEQASGERATPASDVYAFGVVLYRMLAGRFPFESENVMALLSMHVREQPPPLGELRPDVPPRLESVATAALAKNPAERPPDGAALVRELGDGETAVTRALSAAVPGGRGVPVRAMAIAGAALAVAAAGTAAALLATGATDDEPPPASPNTTRQGTSTPDATQTEAPPETTTAPTTQETTAPETTQPETTAPTTTETEPLPTTVPTETLPPTTDMTVPAPTELP